MEESFNTQFQHRSSSVVRSNGSADDKGAMGECRGRGYGMASNSFSGWNYSLKSLGGSSGRGCYWNWKVIRIRRSGAKICFREELSPIMF